MRVWLVVLTAFVISLWLWIEKELRPRINQALGIKEDE